MIKGIQTFIRETIDIFDTDEEASLNSYWQEFVAYDYYRIAEVFLQSEHWEKLPYTNEDEAMSREELAQTMRVILSFDENLEVTGAAKLNNITKK
jgi:hypothetical protein